MIPLDNNGIYIRPIGIGEVLRRIIGKTMTHVIKTDILQNSGSLQLYAGHTYGCEAAVHAMSDIFEEEGNDFPLLVDASTVLMR